MQPGEMLYRKHPETGDVGEDVNPWKVLGWGLIVFVLGILAVYLWHLFDGHDAVLGWKSLAIIVVGGGLIGGALVTRPGDVIDLAFRRFGGEDDDG